MSHSAFVRIMENRITMECETCKTYIQHDKYVDALEATRDHNTTIHPRQINWAG